MLILLPPSEGKSAPLEGPRLDIADLSFPSLNPTRRRVLSALVTMCRGDIDSAARFLGLGSTQRGEVRANARLRREPCSPAIGVYSGVVYEALDHASLTPRAQDRAQQQVAIASALWGLVRPGDAIPAYRLNAGATLPDLGTLSSVWRPSVTTAIASTEGLVVDFRSSAYVGLGPIPPALCPRAVSVRVLTERNGVRTVVSHSNKATKGRIVRSLLQARSTPEDLDAFAHGLANDGYHVEVTCAGPRRPDVLDVVVAAV